MGRRRTPSPTILRRQASPTGSRSQICEHELIAHDRLAYNNWNFKIEYRPGIDEGVKLAFFATRIDASRQGCEQFFVKLSSEEFGIELVGINTGQLCPHARSNHRACQFMSRLFPQGKYWL